jgi:glutathione S-transferase
MLRLYDYLPSGNGYKCRLALAELGLPYERIELDIVAGETRTDAFLNKNPNGKIPALELDDGRVLAESNAILWYLAEDTALLPGEAYDRADVLRWMFFEQYSHEPFIATSRFILEHLPADSPRRDELPAKQEPGHAALSVMERHLTDHAFFVTDEFSIADIALYAYTHVAPDGGFDLKPYSAVRAWLERVAARPLHVAITEG